MRQPRRPRTMLDSLPVPKGIANPVRDELQEELIYAGMVGGEFVAESTFKRETPGNWIDLPEPVHATFGSRTSEPILAAEPSDLRDVLAEIDRVCSENPAVMELAAAVSKAFGNGDILQAWYRNVFPNEPSTSVSSMRNRVLTKTEIKILRLAAGDRPQAEIAGILDVATSTVNKHFENIYRKLEVDRPLQAVARAISLGCLELSAMNQLYEGVGCKIGDFDGFQFLLRGAVEMKLSDIDPATTSLASLGLLLVAISAIGAVTSFRNKSLAQAPARRLLKLDTSKTPAKVVADLRLGDINHLCIAPLEAASYGFTPGHIYASVNIPDRSANQAMIVEADPDGTPRRAFTGGTHVAARLTGGTLLFAPDGRLLATSGTITDGLLEFTEGGRTVRRLADGCFVQACFHPNGHLYATNYSSSGCVIRELKPTGELIGTFGATHPGIEYGGIAATKSGFILASRLEAEQGWIDVFDADGNAARSFPVDGLSHGYLAVDSQERLFVPCRKTGDVKVYAPDGRLLQRIDLKGVVEPRCVAVGGEFDVWVCGVNEYETT